MIAIVLWNAIPSNINTIIIVLLLILTYCVGSKMVGLKMISWWRNSKIVQCHQSCWDIWKNMFSILNVTNDDEEICLKNLKYKAEVIVKLCVHFCVCVSKTLRKWTQTDTKVTFHPPPTQGAVQMFLRSPMGTRY